MTSVSQKTVLSAARAAGSSSVSLPRKQEGSAELRIGATGVGILTAFDMWQDSRVPGSLTVKKSSIEQSGTAVTFALLVKGNASDVIGNPMSKIKYTARQQWMAKPQEYGRYKDHVRAAVIDALRGTVLYPLVVRNIGMKGKPFKTSLGMKGTMHIFIHWKDDRHGDPEGVFGAIADAIFSQDKYLAGSMDFERIPGGRGLVEVVIKLEN